MWKHVEKEPYMRSPKCSCSPLPAWPHRATHRRTWMLLRWYRIRSARRRQASRRQQHRWRIRTVQDPDLRSWQLRSAVRRLPCHANWLGPYSQWRIAKLTMPGEASQQTMRLRQRRWTGCLTCLCHCKRLCFFAWAPTVTCQRQRSPHCCVEIVPPYSPHAPRTYNSTRGPGPSGIASARSSIPTG
ncbi:unnamed protein product [Symbiodinium microadriaticum]|nr:unnamed protein product [Symbiodinium microadriaticum]